MKPNLHHFVLAACLGAATCSAAETPTAALLVLNKGDNTLAIVDPVAAKVIARLPSGPDPHEVVASKGLAFISNYGGNNTLSVVDLVAQEALTSINLGVLRLPHGLWVAQGKVYFTAEANKIIDGMTQRQSGLIGCLAWDKNGPHDRCITRCQAHLHFKREGLPPATGTAPAV
jgi:hypothetical protein